MSRTAIYGLVDPRDGRIRFVGQTWTSLPRRLASHICPPKHQQGSPKDKWVVELLSLGQQPTIVLLEMVAHADADAAERRWIRKLRKTVPDLLNCQDGGKRGYARRTKR